MGRYLLFFLLVFYSADTLAAPHTSLEPRPPFGATWTMSLEQVRNLPDLERNADGTLKASYTIHATSQIELVARWQGHAISFLIAHNFGLYAIALDMVPQADRHPPIPTDIELRDLEHCAPVRLAILQKYGTPHGLAESWDVAEVPPFPTDHLRAPAAFTANAIDWPYARNWLIWKGPDTRLALGEQFVWYVSEAGLTHKQQARHLLAETVRAAQKQEAERQAQRQQQLERARQAVPSRARDIHPFF
jgi:hypothetical protein